MAWCTFRRTAVGASFLLAPLPAHAVCGPSPPMHVWPHRGVPVPTNAHVFLSAPATWRGDATMSLVTAPRKNRPASHIALKAQSWRSADVERFELIPATPLDPSTAYELRSSRGEILGVFTTSVLEDKRSPTWLGIKSGQLRREPARGVVVVPEECGSDLLTVEGPSTAIDDQTTSDDLRYALWIGKPGTPLDYLAPPVTWATRNTPVAQHPFTLSYSDFELPKERPVRIGIKAYDLAANASDPSEVTLE